MYEEYAGQSVPPLYATLSHYSPGIRAKLKRNEPVSLDWVLENARKAGLEVGEVTGSGYGAGVILSDGEVREAFTATGTTIHWRVTQLSGKTITFASSIKVQGWIDERKLGRRLLEAVGFSKTDTVELDEGIVRLDPPDWVKERYRYPYDATAWCLDSEVSGYLRAYLDLISKE